MEKIAPKDLQNSLPIAIMLPATGISGAQTEPVSKRSGQGGGEFSEKLSAALDQPESAAKKANTKPVKEARNEEKQESPQSGLPIGLAWTQPEVQNQTQSLPENGGNIAQPNQTGIVEALLQNKGVISAAVQTLMGPVAAAATQVVAKAVQTLMKPETPVAVAPVNAGTTSPASQTAVNNLVKPIPAESKAQVPVSAAPITAEATPIVDHSTQEQTSLQRVSLPNSPVLASVASVQQAVSQNTAISVAQSSTQEQPSLQRDSLPNNPVLASAAFAQPAVSQNTAIPVAQIVTAAKQQSGASIDPQIQQDIQTVQV